ncbi:hypothetical protein C0Q70_06390 [Pomacea canaliculata]|uniref:Transient receptor ion channel domain-containing protein n=1 Tax=Pomacea canaliculata TaxID=400727 RepID=A0A2T7PNV8_POMCA|nr:hypothetical protein C0Q70_06390 [Pomacea canaliculata]
MLTSMRIGNDVYSLLCVANNCKESSVVLLAAAFLFEVREDVCKEVKSCMILSVAVRHHDHGDPLAPRVAREKRGASRLNLSSDKNRSLSSLEEDFIYAAEFGDIPTVRRVLEENANFSVDYSDILGRTPLRLAVGNEHLEVVELLLDRCNLSTIHEALLQAISAGHEQIRRDHPQASQECANKLEFDQLRLAKTRLNAYKGLASGAYISLSSKDPVLTAFELARELRQTDYLALADQLSDYVVKLLDKIRGHDELQVLINKTGADSEAGDLRTLGETEAGHPLPRETGGWSSLLSLQDRLDT